MIISIASQKGGTGKTSSSLSIASGLADIFNKKVLLVDIDPQANSSKVLVKDYQKISKEDSICATILERKPLPTHSTSIENLDIVPSHILLSNTDIELTTAKDHREGRLNRELEKVKDDYDFVIIDCPPTLSWLTINAFTASDHIIIVVAPGYFELDSLNQIGKTIKEVREYFHPDINLLGYLFVMSDPTINSRTSLKILRQTYTEKVFNTIIPRNTDLRDAHFNKQVIFRYNKEAKSSQAYKKLISELLERL